MYIIKKLKYQWNATLASKNTTTASDPQNKSSRTDETVEVETEETEPPPEVFTEETLSGIPAVNESSVLFIRYLTREYLSE